MRTLVALCDIFDCNLGSVAAADFDGDGDVDLVANGTEELNMLVNRGDGRFDLRIQATRVRGEDMQHGDVDADGRQDLVMTTGLSLTK